MIRAGRRALVLAVAAVALTTGAAMLFSRPSEPPTARDDKPTLLLLTSLPLLFGDDFSLEAAGSPALTALERRYKVVAIPTSAARELARGRLLLMAHPLAQPAEDLVALDQWVREGGRVMLLADPLLLWPDHRPLGDYTRPPPMFTDTGLLRHWGLTLKAPAAVAMQTMTIGGRELGLSSAGQLSGKCRIRSEGLIADCLIGKGQAVVIADADLLNPQGPAGPDGITAIVAELAILERR